MTETLSPTPSAVGETPKARSAYLALLTPPRFVAALAVVYLHWFTRVAPGAKALGLELGDLAVQFFFLLSGFILAHVHGAEGAKDRRNFYAARFARIYPAYLVGLALQLPWYLPALAHLGLAAAVLQPLAVLALVQGFVPGWATAWNVPAWSLSAEALFYLLFPFVGPFFARLRGASAWGAFVLLLGVEAVVVPRALGWAALRLPGGADTLYRNGLFHLPTFLLGIVAYAVWRSFRGRVPSALGFPMVGLGLGLVLLAVEPAWTATLPGVVRASLPSLGFSAVVLGFALAPEPARPSRLLDVGTALGEASYALYVVHYGVLRVFMAFWPQNAAPWLGFGLFALVATTVALVVDRCVEGPTRRFLRRRLMRPAPAR